MGKIFAWAGALVLLVAVHFGTAPWSIQSFADSWSKGDADCVLADVELDTILNNAVQQKRKNLEDLNKENLRGASTSMRARHLNKPTLPRC